MEIAAPTGHPLQFYSWVPEALIGCKKRSMIELAALSITLLLQSPIRC